MPSVSVAWGLLVNGMALWTPTFLARTYGWEVSDAGVAYGALLLVFGGSGVWLGGWVADRIDRKGRVGGPFLTASLCALGVVIPAVAYPLMPTAHLSLLVMAPMILFLKRTLGCGRIRAAADGSQRVTGPGGRVLPFHREPDRHRSGANRGGASDRLLVSRPCRASLFHWWSFPVRQRSSRRFPCAMGTPAFQGQPGPRTRLAALVDLFR